MMIEIVLKIGGRLGRGDNLKVLCHHLADLGRRHHILVVPGGGSFADIVRDYDSRYRLSRDTSHWMAILAMDQFGYILSELIPESEPVRSLVTARKIAVAGRVPVLTPFDLLWRTDPLEHSWEVTSDSIAAWVAELAGVHMLVLLKDVDGLYMTRPHEEDHVAPLDTIMLDQLAVCEGVDPRLASLMKANGLELWIINGEKPERLVELFKTGHTKGTYMKR